MFVCEFLNQNIHIRPEWVLCPQDFIPPLPPPPTGHSVATGELFCVRKISNPLFVVRIIKIVQNTFRAPIRSIEMWWRTVALCYVRHDTESKQRYLAENGQAWRTEPWWLSPPEPPRADNTICKARWILAITSHFVLFCLILAHLSHFSQSHLDLIKMFSVSVL